MTVPTLTNSVVYVGNGSATSFAVPFKVLDEDHLVVKRRVAATGATDHTYIGTDYSYSGIGADSGTLTLSGAALTSTYELVIERIVPYTQDLDIVNSGGFYPETVEEQLDLTTMQIQQIAAQSEDIGARALMVPAGETVGLLPPLADLTGKFLAFDAEGNPTAASGTGADTALRTDLAASTGATLIGWLRAATGAVARSLADWFEDRTSVMDFIPFATRVQIRLTEATVDCTAYFQAADDYLGDNFAGGTLHIPRGVYPCEGRIDKNPYTSWIGEGANDGGSVLLWPADYVGASGSPAIGVKVNSGSNGGGVRQTRIRGLSLGSAAGAAVVGTTIGFYDIGSHNIVFDDFTVGGWKYGCVLDQTEVATFIGIHSHSNKRGLWCLNGEVTEIGNTGHSTQYTNAITILRGNFNGNTEYAIVHDGGEGFAAMNCNINGPGQAFRLAGLNIAALGPNLYIEGISGKSAILLTNLPVNGGGSVGSCTLKFSGNTITAPASHGAIECVTAAGVSVSDNSIQGSGYVVKGAANALSVVTRNNSLGGLLAGVIDGTPTAYNIIDEGRRSVSFTWNPASVAAGTQTSVNTTVTGFGVDDVVLGTSFSNSRQGGRMWSDFTADNTLTTYFRNPTGTGTDPIDLASGTVTVQLIAKQP